MLAPSCCLRRWCLRQQWPPCQLTRCVICLYSRHHARQAPGQRRSSSLLLSFTLVAVSVVLIIHTTCHRTLLHWCAMRAVAMQVAADGTTSLLLNRYKQLNSEDDKSVASAVKAAPAVKSECERSAAHDVLVTGRGRSWWQLRSLTNLRIAGMHRRHVPVCGCSLPRVHAPPSILLVTQHSLTPCLPLM